MSTSSTRASKPRLAFAALAIALGVYCALNLGLMGLSDWAERSQGSHPFRNEDWLRYLLDSNFGRASGDDILLVGASSVRENILTHGIEPVDAGGRVLLGALSQGTLEDTVLGLEYLERVHESATVPRTIVLGLTARSVGGFNKDFSPFQFALEKYSPYYEPTREGGDDQLVEKTLVEGLQGRFRFFFKQRNRYRKAICAALAHPFGWPTEAELFAEMPNMRKMWGISRLGRQDVEEAVRAAQEVGFGRSLLLWMRLYVAQYKYHQLAPRTEATIVRWVSGPGYWRDVTRWDPADADDSLGRLIERLLEFAARNDAKLLVVNMPEHPFSAERYVPGNYDRYLALLRSSFGDSSVLDLRSLLSKDEFHDITHATAEGAARVTARVNQFVQGSHTRSSP